MDGPQRTPSVDSTSPVPLYHQIAESIRERIESGLLAPGSHLEPLREAARKWGVNPHTVRQAYAALARQGLVATSRGRGGTRVTRSPLAGGSADPRDIDRFLERVRREAHRRLGLGSRALLEAMLARFGESASERPAVWVVECSEWQCRCHGREIEERWSVEARSWPLTTKGEPPGDPVVATLFHYNDIRTLWPERLQGIAFVALHPDPALRSALSGRGDRVLVYARDEARAAAVIADMRRLFGEGPPRFEPLIHEHPGQAPPLEGTGPPVLLPPRTWAALDDAGRSHPRAVELRYVIDPRDLERLGPLHGWTPSAGGSPAAATA